MEKDIWSFIVNAYSQLPIGYINALPVSHDVYCRFCKGELSETEIRASQIVDYDTDIDDILIVFSIAIKKGVSGEETINKGRIPEMLIMSFIYKVNQHNRCTNRLKKMAAFAWTRHGENYVKGLG